MDGRIYDYDKRPVFMVAEDYSGPYYVTLFYHVRPNNTLLILGKIMSPLKGQGGRVTEAVGPITDPWSIAKDLGVMSLEAALQYFKDIVNVEHTHVEEER